MKLAFLEEGAGGETEKDLEVEPKLDGVAPLVTDPPRANSTPLKSQHI